MKPVETSQENQGTGRESGRVLAFPRNPFNRKGRKDELEFLPAALEILETPASPIGRAMVGTLLLFVVLAIAWATFGYVDIIATAQGKIVPVGRVKVIQPLESGIVTAIHVRDSDRVTAGQVLVELDRTVTIAERNRIANELLHLRLDSARLRALRAGIDGDLTPVGFAPPPEAPNYEVERTRAVMIAQANQQAAKIASLDQQIAQKSAESMSLEATIEKLRAGLPLAEETADIRRKAMMMEYGNRIAHLEAQARLTDQRSELIVQQRRGAELVAARQALERQREQSRAEYALTIIGDLAEAEQKAGSLAEELTKAEKKMQDQVLRAPVDGIVQQLALHTVGGVVTPAQALMIVVPADSHIEIEAMVPNKDIGFVHDGDEAEIKIDTFNFTRYGLLHGRVLNVSGDAIIRDKPAGQGGGDKAKDNNSMSRSSEPQGQELVYAARVSLDRTQMQIDDRLVNLAPGMAVTVEIKTGQRRIVEYVLSPLLRYKQESLRER
jgi:hemolysin D